MVLMKGREGAAEWIFVPASYPSQIITMSFTI